MDKLRELFEKLIGSIDVKSIETTALEIIAAIAVVFLTLWMSRKVERFIDRRLAHDDFDSEQVVRNYRITSKIVIMTTGILVAMHILGIDLSALFTGGGMFALAMAFVMKNITENYISGILIRVERKFKVGDVLEGSDGQVGRVKMIGKSSTVLRTRDEKDVILPNSLLLNNRTVNYTYTNSLCRVEANVGVAYSSDLDEVQRVLEHVCEECDWKVPQSAFSVLLFSFGDSAVNYKVRVMIDDPWVLMRRRALLNQAIWRALKEADITIAFPQLDVHFDEPLKGQPAAAVARVEQGSL